MDHSALEFALAGLLRGVKAFALAANLQKELDIFLSRLPKTWQSAAPSSSSPFKERIERASRVAGGVGTITQKADGDGRPLQLRSIFCHLEADGVNQSAEDLYWPVGKLTMQENVVFPHPSAEHMESKYSDLWRAFVKEADRKLFPTLTKENTNVTGSGLESLLLLLQRFAWCVPSEFGATLPDTSTFDHARMTAAVASAFPAKETDASAVLLVGGDITGVQDFIYTITARGATGALRGRSFYLQMLTEVVARYVLEALDLPITSLIYAGGGNFYLLARTSDAVKVIDAQIAVGNALMRAHRGDLHLAIASIPILNNDFFDGSISSRWGDLARALQQVKLRRYAELKSEIMGVFVPEGSGGDRTRLCSVCGGEEDPAEMIEDQDQQDDNDLPIRKCRRCVAFEKLGDDLREANYLVLETPAPAVLANEVETYQQVFNDLGWRAGVYKDLTNLPILPESSRRIVLAFTDQAYEEMPVLHGTAAGLRYSVNITPLLSKAEVDKFRDKVDGKLRAGQIKPFDVLQQQSRGISRLGVLRMDVDNMGDLFSKGFGETATLARIASLSAAVSRFFEGWVGHLAREINNESAPGDVYAIYSGGDDLFFVGSWDRVLELSRRIRIDLSRYAAFHPGIHASAGMALVGGKYPLAQAAQDAARAENQAKSFTWCEGNIEHKKDAVSFLGQALPWSLFGMENESEIGFSTAHTLKNYLVDHKDKLHPLYQRLILLQAMYDKAGQKRRDQGDHLNRQGKHQTLWGPWNWLSYYMLSRLAKQTGIREIAQLNDRLKSDEFRSIEWIGLAARWAELASRGNSHKGEVEK